MLSVVHWIALFGLFLPVYSSQETNEEWRRLAREDIKRAKKIQHIDNLAKNLILMVGDGMGFPTITAARIYKGQKNGMSGEENKLAFEDFPHIGIAKTYNLDRQVPDSAGSATAMLTGVKVNMGTLGVDGSVPFSQNCSKYGRESHLRTLLDHALDAGKSVGLVSTSRLTHATPAAAYAHTPWRDWESDAHMSKVQGCDQVKDIAYQLVMDNPNIHVLLGGGRENFLTNSTPDPLAGIINQSHRRDRLDLRQKWKEMKSASNARHSYVETKQELDTVDPESTDFLLGLFSMSHMTYELERDSSLEPSLTEMTEKAILILKKNPSGYFLLVEGARIDMAHHENLAKKALEETAQFDNAVRKVLEMTSDSDTLVIVTADHSHSLGIAGYPTRGNNILGLVDDVLEGESPTDGLPYLTLNYANGPASGRRDLSQQDVKAHNFQQPGCIQMPVSTHGGEDVPIYAQGPMAYLFHSTHEQSYIAHVMMYAACIGEYRYSCDYKARTR